MQARRYYCTLFDQNYLARGLALHASLTAHDQGSILVALCLDDTTFRVLSSLQRPGLRPLSLAALEQSDADLAATRASRSAAEYYFTCKSGLMRHVLGQDPDAVRVTYLDSDLYYFDSPAAIEAEIGGSSVALTPHRFPSRLRAWARYGDFNAGWISVSGDDEGREFLEWWRCRCIASCSIALAGERFADQGYLNQVPRLFRRSHVVEHLGANVGPWRIAEHRVERQGDRVMLDDHPLVFYHFHQLRRVCWRLYDSGLSGYGARMSRALRELVYRPYLDELIRAAAHGRSSLRADSERPLCRSNLRAAARTALLLARSGNGMLASSSVGPVV